MSLGRWRAASADRKWLWRLFRQDSQLVVEAWERHVHVHVRAGEDRNVSPPLATPACTPYWVDGVEWKNVCISVFGGEKTCFLLGKFGSWEMLANLIKPLLLASFRQSSCWLVQREGTAAASCWVWVENQTVLYAVIRRQSVTSLISRVQHTVLLIEQRQCGALAWFQLGYHASILPYCREIPCAENSVARFHENGYYPLRWILQDPTRYSLSAWCLNYFEIPGGLLGHSAIG